MTYFFNWISVLILIPNIYYIFLFICPLSQPLIEYRHRRRIGKSSQKKRKSTQKTKTKKGKAGMNCTFLYLVWGHDTLLFPVEVEQLTDSSTLNPCTDSRWEWEGRAKRDTATSWAPCLPPSSAHRCWAFHVKWPTRWQCRYNAICCDTAKTMGQTCQGSMTMPMTIGDSQLIMVNVNCRRRLQWLMTGRETKNKKEREKIARGTQWQIHSTLISLHAQYSRQMAGNIKRHRQGGQC